MDRERTVDLPGGADAFPGREKDLEERPGVAMKHARFLIAYRGRAPEGVRPTPAFIRRQVLPALRRPPASLQQPDPFEPGPPP